MAAPTAQRSLDLGTLLRYAAAALTAGAGFIHLDAASDHPAHTHITVFFVVLALAQVTWAAAVAWRPERTDVLRAGLLGTAAVVALWVVSRTTGVPFVSGAADVEPVAIKDALTTFMELLTLGAGGLLLALPDSARQAALPSSERVSAAVLAGALALTVPGVLAGHGHGDGHGEHGDGAAAHVAGPAGHHDDGDGKGGDGHGHPGDEVASGAGHGHDDGGDGDGHHDGMVTAAGHLEHQDHETVPLDEVLHAGHASGDGHDLPGHMHGDGDHAGHHGASGPSGPSIVTAAAQRRAFREAPGKVATVRWGPIVVPGASSEEARHSNVVLANLTMTQLPPPCRDCYVTAMAPDLFNSDGSRANFDTGAWLHHNVTFQSEQNDPTCERNSMIGFLGKRIFAAGNERTAASFPDGFGYYVPESSWWSAVFHIANTKEEPQTVEFEFKVKYLPGNAEDVKRLTPVWLDFDNCQDSELDMPAGRTTTTWDWKSTLTGRIVAAAGHVHDGGVSIDLSNADTGEHVCKSVASYGTRPSYQGNIDTMSVCSWDRIGRVREGETLRLDTVYDSDTPVPGAMGIMVVFIHETDDLDGGTKAPESMTNPPDQGKPPTHGGHDH